MKTSKSHPVRLCFFFTALFVLSASGNSYAQETPSAVMSPLRISPKYENGIILLTFEPVPGTDVRYRVYRSTEPMITEADLQAVSVVAEITADRLPLTDNPAEDGRYYYAVTAVTGGNEIVNLIPYQNTTLKPVRFSPLPQPVQSITIVPIDDHAAQEPAAQEPAVSIRFDYPEEGLAYNLYTSREPRADLNGLLPVKTLEDIKDGDGKKKKGEFIIKVETDRPYYFAVTSVNRLGAENRSLNVGRNTSSSPLIFVHPKKKAKKPPVRKKTNREIIEDNLRNNFYRGKYKNALNVFENHLKTMQLTSNERALVNFSMAQCFFYLEQYDKAVKYFILSKEDDAFREMADAWTERCLEKINGGSE